jgi:hypothetical protein
MKISLVILLLIACVGTTRSQAIQDTLVPTALIIPAKYASLYTLLVPSICQRDFNAHFITLKPKIGHRE